MKTSKRRNVETSKGAAPTRSGAVRLSPAAIPSSRRELSDPQFRRFDVSTFRRSPAAFTLTETLAAIAVVALLAGLLLPVLARVRGSAVSTACRSNLRQMGVACRQYTTRYQSFPAAIRYESAGGFRRVAWDWETTFAGELLGPGPLWGRGADPGAVHQCPGYQGPSNAAGDPHTGYNYNASYLGGVATFPSVGWSSVRGGLTMSMVMRSARCALFGDGGWASGANKFMRAPLEDTDLDVVYSGGQAFRHGKTTNVVYVDGHVGGEETPEAGARATADLLERIMDFPRNGFLSDDDDAYRPR